MQKWQYLVLVRTYNLRTKRFEWSDTAHQGKSGQQLLNELGQQGWELTTTASFRESVESDNVHYMLKRPC